MVLFIFAAILIQHSLCPVYDFPPVSKFSGDKFYNPYADISGKKMVKANFHAHSRVWGGLTNGSKNKKEDLVQRYKYLNYDIAGISDYQSINTYQQDNQLYIPEYEHGYGLTKNHQLSIGTKNVLWNDYLLFQTIDDKQYIIKELRERSEIIVIAHPFLRKAYDSDDMMRLTDYDGIEILNHNFGKALPLWDAALSSGHLVFGFGDDDSHSSENVHDMGGCFNIIFCDTMTGADVIKSLKAGRSYSVNQDKGETMEYKKLREEGLPFLICSDLVEGKVEIEFDKPAKEIDFISQGGIIAQKDNGVKLDTYTIQSSDTYIRVEAVFDDGTEIYLNPIVRYSGDGPQYRSAAVNLTKTWILRTVSGVVFIGIVYIIGYFKRRAGRSRIP